MKEEAEESPYDRPEEDASPEDAETPDKGEKEMSFLDHLEELRWRIIYSMIGIVVCAVGLWFFIDPLMENVV